MDEFARIKTFIKTVEAGSFSAAARGVSSTSAVTRQVKSLEEELGVRLFNRSTRRLSLTDAGRRFYERMTAIAHDLENITSEVKSMQEDTKGVLRVSLRLTIGATIVIPALPDFLARYPELELDISLTDERQDLIANGIDVALWSGSLPNAEVVARRLSPGRCVVCGTPDYFKEHGVPREPQDLRDHNCLSLASTPHGERWGFRSKGGRQEVEIRGNIRSDNGLILLSAGLANLCVLIGHERMMLNLLAEGKVTRVLTDYIVEPPPGEANLYAVYPTRGGLSRRARVFIDFLVETFEGDSTTG